MRRNPLEGTRTMTRDYDGEDVGIYYQMLWARAMVGSLKYGAPLIPRQVWHLLWRFGLS